MNLIKWTPNNTAVSILHNFDNIFNSISNLERYENDNWAPTFNVSESDKRFVVYADMPGVERKNLIIELDDGVVNISGERFLNSDEADVYYTNCTSGEFSRSFNLPENCNGEKVSAKLKNGVLELSIPKVEKVRNIKKISIK